MGGYLALAASQCNQQERQQVYDKLKTREDALRSGADGFVLYTAGKDLNDTLGGQRPEFTAEVDRSNGGSLGLTIDGSTGVCLVIEEVNVGLLRDWNADHPISAVRPGDRIVAVNNVRGSAAQLT